MPYLVQHDIGKAILADFSLEQGLGYLNSQVYYDYWEEVIDIGWDAFCSHTGLTRERVKVQLEQLREAM